MNHIHTAPSTRYGSRPLVLAALLLALLILAPAAHASKQTVDFFGGAGTLGGQFGGTEVVPSVPSGATGIAVNNTGAGPANAGDIYVGDPENNRVERFGRDDNGTPVDTADDTYFFISTWGADVVQAGGAGNQGDAAASDYEICTVASQCKAAVATGGNGSVAGDGSLAAISTPNFHALYGALTVDQDTGNVYVVDAANYRVNVYDGTGVFLRSFGYDVVATGPDNAGSGYEVCVAASGDVCKAGLPGANPGQIGNWSQENVSGADSIAVSTPDSDATTGTVFLADAGNRRVDTYALDGTAPSSLGSASQFGEFFPRDLAVDSRGILYASNQNGIERYDTLGADGPSGFLAPINKGVNEVQRLTISATAGSFRLSIDPDGAGPEPTQTTNDIPYNSEIKNQPRNNPVVNALRELPYLSSGDVVVGGGPGNAAGSKPYEVSFDGALGAQDVPQLTVSNGAIPLSGGSGASVTTTTPGQPGLSGFGQALAVDPDEDGAGPETDVLYTDRIGVIQQFGPVNQPGLSTPPASDDARHGATGPFHLLQGLAVESSTGRLYGANTQGTTSDSSEPGVYVLDNSSPTQPTASLDSIDNITTHSAELHATVNPNGPPATRYHFEYVTDAAFQASGFEKATSTSEVLLGAQEIPQAITETIDPAPLGLGPNTTYHVRLVAGRHFGTPITTPPLEFTTDSAPPLAETTGAPVRTATTTQLTGRVTPLGTATAYHFEYGTEGSCDANPCSSTPAMPAGSGQLTQLVGEEVTELAPDTTYHYRLIAEGFGVPVTGADMTVTTHSSDAPLSHGPFPGPPGSDRAWEQVSLPDSSGNPVNNAEAFSTSGDRAVYSFFGGTPLAHTASIFNRYFAQRPPGQHPTSGWQTSLIEPPRDALAGFVWHGVLGPPDLSTIYSYNLGNDSGAFEGEIWRLSSSAAPTLLERGPGERFGGAGENVPFGVSEDGSRVVAFLKSGAVDPTYPGASGLANVYDIGASPPQLLSLLPGNLVSPCPITAPEAFKSPSSHWLSPDGSLLYFEDQESGPCGIDGAPSQLYLREIDAGQTKRISPPPLSGPDCGADLVKATPGAAFFWTQSRLDPADTSPSGCGVNASGGDVYRYELATASLECLTCVVPGFPADVSDLSGNGNSVLFNGPAAIAVSDDGSRLYFSTEKRLLPGASSSALGGVYRLDVGSGDLAFVAPIAHICTFCDNVELSPDGETLLFSSDSPALNPLGGTADNGGGVQYYRYSDTDRSLICVSCPRDGSAPVGQQTPNLYGASERGQPNRGSLSADGQTIAFSTPTPLLPADQNTPGPGHFTVEGEDVYEWRDGRLLLVTDGLTSWPTTASGDTIHPTVLGITPSGSDIFFTTTAAYTPDALDNLSRLYDARVGGGIDFPPAAKPCSLEACQGTPKGTPEEQPPGTSDFRGPGNPPQESKSCPKGRRRVHGSCVKRHHRHKRHRAANRNRRTVR